MKRLFVGWHRFETLGRAGRRFAQTRRFFVPSAVVRSLLANHLPINHDAPLRIPMWESPRPTSGPVQGYSRPRLFLTRTQGWYEGSFRWHTCCLREDQPNVASPLPLQHGSASTNQSVLREWWQHCCGAHVGVGEATATQGAAITRAHRRRETGGLIAKPRSSSRVPGGITDGVGEGGWCEGDCTCEKPEVRRRPQVIIGLILGY